jgi:hypothetical protein
MNRIIIALVLISIAQPAYAWPRSRRSSSSGSRYSAPVGGDTSTAQGVAEIQARLGRVGHFGGNSGYEGCGSGPTPEAAIRNCCYYGRISIQDQGVAQGANGMFYACIRGR